MEAVSPGEVGEQSTTGTAETELEDGATAGLEDRRMSHLMRLDISLV